MLNNIVLAGGGFLYKGMVDRFRTELIARVDSDDRFKNIKEIVKENAMFADLTYPCNLISWSGGMIFFTFFQRKFLAS